MLEAALASVDLMENLPRHSTVNIWYASRSMGVHRRHWITQSIQHQTAMMAFVGEA